MAISAFVLQYMPQQCNPLAHYSHLRPPQVFVAPNTYLHLVLRQKQNRPLIEISLLNYFLCFFWLGSNAGALSHRLVNVVVDGLEHGAWIRSLGDRTAND